jgi:hypothetical protein
MIRDGLKKNPTKWTKYAEALQGATLTFLKSILSTAAQGAVPL